jgi:hypothetical protein
MQRVEVHLEDDLTGGPADETVKFGMDGADYEVDLSNRHATEFRRQLAPFVQHARPAQTQRARPRARTAASRERSRDIRAWAEQQGFAVAEHGRLPADVVREYDQAHGSYQSAGRGTQRPAGRKASSGRGATKPQRRAKSTRRRRTGPLTYRPAGAGLPRLRGGRDRGAPAVVPPANRLLAHNRLVEFC